MSTDFPLPLSPTESQREFWWDEEPHPTNFIVLWPEQLAPTFEGVVSALGEQRGGIVQILEQPSTSENDLVWKAILALPGEEIPVIVWCEQMRPMLPEQLKTLHAESVKWAVGFETLLHPNRPLEHFVNLLRTIGRAFPHAPAILDVNKEGWHTRDELDTMLLPEDAIITESIMWTIHGISAENPPSQDSKVWLYTNGLARCGMPELEMLDVPHPYVGSALALLNSIGELVVQNGMPQPGKAVEVGADLAVVFQPWQEVAPFVDEKSLGGNDRVDHNGMAANGNRAVLCAAVPKGAYRKIWVWPEEVVKRVAQSGSTVLYKTERSAKQQMQMARRTFDQLMAAFEMLPRKLALDGPDRQAVFLIKAGFPHDGGKHPEELESFDGREHLWFEVKGFKRGRAEAVLLNDPVSINRMRKGDHAQLDRGIVSDWQVLTRQGTFGPGNVEGLRQILMQAMGATT